MFWAHTDLLPLRKHVGQSVFKSGLSHEPRFIAAAD